MSSKWPWYTEWNGIFMPVEDALAMGMITFFLSLIGHLFYLLFGVVAEGFGSLGRKEWGTGILYLGVVAAPIALCVGTLAVSVGGEAAFYGKVKIESSREIPCSEAGGCGFCLGGPAMRYTVYNGSDEAVDILLRGEKLAHIETGGKEEIEACRSDLTYKVLTVLRPSTGRPWALGP